MRRMPSSSVAIACLIMSTAVSAQHWTTEELRERTAGFHQGTYRATLQQIAELLANKEHAFAALCGTIQGDHREYMLKIERLLDRLADERWAVREDAERQLVELGARALTLIADRKQHGGTLEERIRSARVEQAIATRGTEDEDAAIRLLRGLVAAADYFGQQPQLASALVSAAGHTDPLVVEGAIRSLGSVGDGTDAAFLVRRLSHLDREHSGQRATVLGSLTRLPGSMAMDALMRLVEEDALTSSELLGVLLDVRQRDDAAALIEKLANGADPVVARIASLEWPRVPEGTALETTMILGDRTELSGPLLGLRSDSISIGSVEGLEAVRVPRQRCAALGFDSADVPLTEGDVRLFTVQGSLIVGRLSSISETSVTISSRIFGDVEVARLDVQGIALSHELDRLIGASTEHDRVRLVGGEVRDGTIESLDSEAITIAAGERKETIPRRTVEGLLFRRPQTGSRSDELFTRLDLVTGERLLVHLGAADRQRLGFLLPGVGAAVVPLSEVKRIEFGVGGGALWGFTLVADYSENAVFELDDQQRVVFRLDDMYGVWDAECLDNGNLLVVEFALGRVVEMTRDRKEVWSFEKLKNPYDADRLPNGNTLIADTYGNRVIEVDRSGQIVWTFDDGVKPLDVERLPNGNTLIADGKRDRVIEVDRAGEIVWSQEDLEGVWDADRLPNGNTLITQRRSSHRVFEVDREGKIVFEITGLSNPSDADRLPNGNTVVAEDGKVREFDRFGNVVWEYPVAWAVEVNRY
ncbi:MAG: PQQ-binding-like beta-propeller repeat protein [Planctomycetes bacterium]|nr:PQQ-binding-like beta-propeller repeat protein [Planctomycetota bacterium]